MDSARRKVHETCTAAGGRQRHAAAVQRSGLGEDRIPLS